MSCIKQNLGGKLIMDLILSLNWLELIGALTAIIGGLLTIALIFPGEQPDKFLQQVLDFLLKLSRK